MLKQKIKAGVFRYARLFLYSFLIILSWLYCVGFRVALTWRRCRGGKTGYPFKVISVGNLAAGGTGKSVLVGLLVQRLGAQQCAVVTRGYRGSNERTGKSLIVSDGQHLFAGPKVAGDEAVMHAVGLAVTVVVGVDRGRSCDLIAQQLLHIRYVILDDAYQNFAVKPDCNILLLDARAPFDNGYCLPAGRLRERDVSRADVIVFTHAAERAQILRDGASHLLRTSGTKQSIRNEFNTARPEPFVTATSSLPQGERHTESAISARPEEPRRSVSEDGRLEGFEQNLAVLKIPHFYTNHKTDGIYLNNETLVPLQDLVGKPLVVCAGVGTPSSVQESVASLGLKVAHELFFDNHHAYAAADIERLTDLVMAHHAAGILTTAKDWVKIAPFILQHPKSPAVFVMRVGMVMIPSEIERLFNLF